MPKIACAGSHLGRFHWYLPFPRAIAVVVMLAMYVALTGFDLSRHSVPLDRIVSTNGSMAGIDAITKPAFITASKATFLTPEDRVVGVLINGRVRAYPLKILTWHQVVDDSIAGNPVAITYCPLTGSAMVYDRTLGKRLLVLETSDLLYDSNLLFYDEATKSLWSQIKGEAITGPLMGKRLYALPSIVTPWAVWKVYHPDTVVLNASVSDIQNFTRDATERYEQAPGVVLPVSTLDHRLPPKERVLGLSSFMMRVQRRRARLSGANTLRPIPVSGLHGLRFTQIPRFGKATAYRPRPEPIPQSHPILPNSHSLRRALRDL
jgi:hypothetical protein